ncbi:MULTISPECIES: putative quinol monooxygenase [unclassified Rathayibacter]|uniref:putative quinol monooxygenase n=1 Tax=unclassified Rathayibacter TaxID=2609250 RepID=UPI000F4C38F6|nr:MULTISPECIES: putative quinol monooxygenase [unclassified Rathayibacter]ROP49128.1 quinol monooxygenase YgiN [Rathayibacter sp. PhB186]ROS50755.1 quinol monooxygenase YgiN [Rathayibacter sp. PhB185]
MLTLTVALDVRPGHLDDFLTAITENATRTFTDEPGCLYFDVCQDVSDELHFVFHEVYTDQDAIEAHRKAPHFAAWRSAADQHVVPGSQINVIARRLAHHS